MMTLELDGETYLNTKEACDLLGGITRQTLDRYVNNGLIRRYRQGLARTAYYKQEDVTELHRKRHEIREDTNE